MDGASFLGYESSVMFQHLQDKVGEKIDPIPMTDSPVWILGKDYSAVHGKSNDHMIAES